MKKIIYTILLSILSLLIACTASKSTFKYSIDKPIEGQLHTVEVLRKLMDEQRYDEAVNLFSAKQQENIQKIKEEGMFEYWYSAWTFDDRMYDSYTNKIKKGQAPFVFEDWTWKIDEK